MMRYLFLLVPLLLGQQAEDKPGRVILKKTKDPEREWALYIPASYKPGVPIPFVLSSHGKDGRGKGEINQWESLAQKHKFIVACPDYSQASGRPGTFDEDEKVTTEIYEYLTKNFSIDKRYGMITGFSGGGMPTYHDGSRYPEKFTFWCPRSANWYPSVLADAEQLKKCVNVPVYIFYGSKDHELILDQAPKAYEILKTSGFKYLKYEKIEGMGHESRAHLAAEWFVAEIEVAKQREAQMAPATKAMAAADKHLEKGKLADAIKELVKAATHMKKYKLGDDADVRIEKLADAELEKAAAAEKDAAIKILEEAKKSFAGTAALKRITDKLAELQK